MAGANPHLCGMCGMGFDRPNDFWDHQAAHADNAAANLQCPQCFGVVEDIHALEEHQRRADHGERLYLCVMCNREFFHVQTLTWHIQTQLESYQTQRVTCFRGTFDCDECLFTALSEQELSAHKRCTHKQKEQKTSGNSDEVSDSLDSTSEDRPYCQHCKQDFVSDADLRRHALGCSGQSNPADSSASHHGNGKQKKKKRTRKTAAPATPQSVYKAAKAVQTPTSSFDCKSEGCGKSFTSEAAFKIHQADIHGVGGKALDLHGNDQYMLSPHMRQQLKNAGVLHASKKSPLAQGKGRGKDRGSGLASSFDLHGPSTTLHSGRVTATGPMASPSYNAAHDASSTPRKQTAKFSTSAKQPLPVSTLAEYAAIPVIQTAPMPTPGAAEIEQAKEIQAQALSLRIQSSIVIYPDGKISAAGKGWSRIELSKQQAVIAEFDQMCHLQQDMQGEHIPVPNAFKDTYTAQYPSSDFKGSPKRDPAKPGVPVVALWCSKVVLANGHEDLVKVSAVDLAKGRILINHFVCADPTANVNNWCSKITRLANWSDMERARLHEFKVFGGWAAVRSALWEFVDEDSIIVGHNLRSDFNALRMIHGRAVDIVLIAEQAAEGPLSKAQLSLGRMCRTYCNVNLDDDIKLGQDCLTNALAIREMALFVVKNRKEFDEGVRQRSRDYQKVMTTASG